MISNAQALFADHISNRQQQLETALEACHYDELLIFSGTETTAFLDDYHYPFKPNPHFMAWLPLTHHADCWLQLRSGKKPVLYYYQPSDYWHAPPATPESWWADHFEIKLINQPLPAQQIVSGSHAVMIGEIEDRRGVGDVSLNPQTLLNHLHLDRTRKTDWELACISDANRIAARAHNTARDAFFSGESEFEIDMRYCRAAGLQEHEMPYGSIVAINEHASTLHYQGKDRARSRQRNAFLIDAGATCYGYAADITRTYCTDSSLFADLLAGMDALELRLAEAAVSGVDYRQLHLRTHHEIAELLAHFGILKVTAEAAVAKGITSTFLPHGLGHYLGLQTHDVAGLIDNQGEDLPRPDGHPFLRLTRVLESSNVLTIEPGLYFIDSLLAKLKASGNAGAVNWELIDQLRPYGGIRIEDNIVVAEKDSRNLTREAFAKL
ncbi:MAG: Xaa-Pro dipeptidase [Xanthomonadales bacterium]|nr:Xaa-Pro dipeptidase [Xanthomonadales bacterium]